MMFPIMNLVMAYYLPTAQIGVQTSAEQNDGAPPASAKVRPNDMPQLSKSAQRFEDCPPGREPARCWFWLSYWSRIRWAF